MEELKLLEFETYTGDEHGQKSEILLLSTLPGDDKAIRDFIKGRRQAHTKIFYQQVKSKSLTLLIKYMSYQKMVRDGKSKSGEIKDDKHGRKESK